MLSRRSVRIKVMQLLFALGRDEQLSYKDARKAYFDRVRMSYDLFLFNLYGLYKICKESENDDKKRKSKHLISDYDRAFTPKLFQNLVVQDIAENKKINAEFEKLNLEAYINEDYISKIYDEFSKKEEYKEFVLNCEKTEDIIELLLELYRFCRQNEFFNEMVEDFIYSWKDDKSLVVGVIKKYLKALPNEDNALYLSHLPDDETVKEYGEGLLEYCHKKNDILLDHIKPVLENWDHERLAIIDMILLKMAIAEFMMFPTIPSKVTINEYVEIAKKYSTAKSKDFINGILDKLAKDLEDKGLMKKEGRGLIED